MKLVSCDQKQEKERQTEFTDKEMDDLVFGHVQSTGNRPTQRKSVVVVMRSKEV